MQKTIEERLNAHPELLKQVTRLLDITESGIERADDAEERAVEGIRKLGQQVLQDWAEHQAKEKADVTRNMDDKPISNGKKKSTGAPRSE